MVKADLVGPHARKTNSKDGTCRRSGALANTSIPHRQEIKMDLVRIILSILLPPLGVFLQVGIGKHFWINILLTLLGYIPGIVHAVYIIARR